MPNADCWTLKVIKIVSHLFILVGCHCNELSLLEDVGVERAVGQPVQVIGLDEVKARLILVHRVEDRLNNNNNINNIVDDVIIVCRLAKLTLPVLPALLCI